MSPFLAGSRPKSGLISLGVLLSALTASATFAGQVPSATPVALSSASSHGKVLWYGGFDKGHVPHAFDGKSCGTGSARKRHNQYSYVQEMGNTRCTSSVTLSKAHTRVRGSSRALKIVMGAHQQREQMASTYTWHPDSHGSVNQWYGFSIFYESNWKMMGGLSREVSASSWHNPVAFRMDGDNGSMNFSGDMNLDNANGKRFKTFQRPHMVLRRNTVQNQRHLYKDGHGLDKLDLGPIVTNKWMDIACHIRWSTTSRNALRECWRDGRYMGRRTTRNAVSSQLHRLRVGQYQDTNLSHPRTTLFDNVRIGTSYAAVNPTRAR